MIRRLILDGCIAAFLAVVYIALYRAAREPEPGAAVGENAVLLRRLDAWTPDRNPGPLIRWAAAHLRGCIACADTGYEVTGIG